MPKESLVLFSGLALCFYTMPISKLIEINEKQSDVWFHLWSSTFIVWFASTIVQSLLLKLLDENTLKVWGFRFEQKKKKFFS